MKDSNKVLVIGGGGREHAIHLRRSLKKAIKFRKFIAPRATEVSHAMPNVYLSA